MLFLLLPVLMFMQTPTTQAEDQSLLTVAESSGYTATSTSGQVLELIHRIASRSTIMHISELGRTAEGKAIPLVFLSNPPVDSIVAARAASSSQHKPIVFIMANIHAGEVEGKEAALMLARELALNPDHPLLKNLIVILAPDYNADGNDKFDDVQKNRPGQIGPAHCGIRANGQGLDLNRDYIKLEAPETRALVNFLNECDPHLTIDCHTTDGSHHRYTLTYEAPLNPSGHPAPIDFVRNQLLPEVTKRVKDHTGYDMWHYGNFNREHTIWETYSAQPRFGGPYQGLRNQMSILSEAYSYAPFKDRVIATREFIREILQYVAENREKVIQINATAREETAKRGMNPQPDDVVGIRHRVAAFNQPVMVKGYERAEGGEGGAAADPNMDLGPPKDFLCTHLGRFESTLSVRRPFAYLIPPGFDAVVEKLRQHGIAVEPFCGRATVEVYTITKIDRAAQAFQGHQTEQLQVRTDLQTRSFGNGSMIVHTGQPLGTLAVYMLDPESEDGLVTWNFFDSSIGEGKEFPVVRVRGGDDLVK